MIPLNELTDFDYAILEKVAGSSNITELALTEAFPEQTAVKLRIDSLSQMDYDYPFPIPNTSYLQRIYNHIQNEYGADDNVYTGKICITPLGQKALEEWRLQKKKEHRKLVEWRITKYAPIIISIIALIVAIISLLQSLHWIHLEQSEILPTPPSQVDVSNSTNSRPSIPSSQSP